MLHDCLFSSDDGLSLTALTIRVVVTVHRPCHINAKVVRKDHMFGISYPYLPIYCAAQMLRISMTFFSGKIYKFHRADDSCSIFACSV